MAANANGQRTEFDRRIERIEGLVEELENATDPALRATAQELVQLVMELHGSGLGRIVEAVRRSSAGEALMDQLTQDELVRSLLQLYDLHPVDAPAPLAPAAPQIVELKYAKREASVATNGAVVSP